MSDEINNCPHCGKLLTDEDKQKIVDNGHCPHCKEKIDFSDVEYVDEEILEEEKLEKANEDEVEEVDEIEDISDLQESDRQEEEKESEEPKEEIEKSEEEVPKEEIKPKKEEEQIEKALDGVKSKEDRNQMAIDIIDQRFLNDDRIVKDIHGSYVSWYATNNETKKRGKRFLVVYRNGRTIKAQFFNDIKPKPEDNKNIVVITPSGKTAYEYRSTDLVDFGKVIDQTFKGE